MKIYDSFLLRLRNFLPKMRVNAITGKDYGSWGYTNILQIVDNLLYFNTTFIIT